MMDTNKKFYSISQILLHWTTALLVFYQLAVNADIKKTYKLFLENGEWPSMLSSQTITHLILGFIILILVLMRLYLRLTIKVPALPNQVPVQLKLLAKASHYLLYFFLLLMPLSGALGWFTDLKFAILIHTFSAKILLALILFHICAAIFHEGVLGNKILRRMFQTEEKLKR